MPFSINGLDSDNANVFINAHMLRYCQENKTTFTRARVGSKNDCCYVGQKNWSVVRRTVGYAGYDTDEEVKILNEIYDVLRLYVNYFKPAAKLMHMERHGAKAKKSYDTPKTPFMILLASPDVSEDVKVQPQNSFEGLNPAELKREINRRLRKIRGSISQEESYSRTTRQRTYFSPRILFEASYQFHLHF